MVWLNILCKSGCIICDVIYVCKHGSFNRRRQNFFKKALRLEKGWSALTVMREFPSRKWKRSTLFDLIKRIDKTGKTDKRKGTCPQPTAICKNGIKCTNCRRPHLQPRRSSWHKQESERNRTWDWYFTIVYSSYSQERSQSENISTPRGAAALRRWHLQETCCLQTTEKTSDKTETW